MKKVINGDKLIIASLRVLILIAQFEYRKSYKLTIDKIMLYDYYMKFPKTMIEQDKEYSFNEYYAFYHWKPDYREYMEIINFLLSRNLIDKDDYIKRGNCLITETGTWIVTNMQGEYKQLLEKISLYLRRNIASKPDKEVEKIILGKYREGIG